MLITAIHDVYDTEGNLILMKGRTITYQGHVPGGLIKITATGKHSWVVSPLCFKEFV